MLYASNPFRDVKLRPALPAILEKESPLLLTFEGPLSLRELYERGSDPDLGSGLAEFDGEPTRRILVTANVESMDFGGDVYHAEIGVMSAHITNSNVVGWGHTAQSGLVSQKKDPNRPIQQDTLSCAADAQPVLVAWGIAGTILLSYPAYSSRSRRTLK